MTGNGKLERLDAGTPIPFGGDRVAYVSPALAEAFRAGDRLIVLQTTGDLLHLPLSAHQTAARAVDRAVEAFEAMAGVDEERISAFFEAFAARLAAAEVWQAIAQANERDVERARARGASVTRLIASETMRRDMIAGLRAWRDAPAGRGRLVERQEHDGWSVELSTAPLGVVGFVFEGRPNVFADAVGVLRGGNTVVFRIGSDALGTARALSEAALAPALREAGLPEGAAALVDSAEHAAGWAMFADPRLSLAVARGSGRAVAQLGAIARQAGTPVSLHGTGGAWLMADAGADPDRFEAAVLASLDRKVCNTLNVCCILRSRAEELTPRFLAALDEAGARRGHGVKLHVVTGSETWLPSSWRTARSLVRRADGDHDEAKVESLAVGDLGVEWEWEESPEVSLVIVESLDEAIDLFNRHSPRFIASVISEEEAAKSAAFAALDAAFVGDGFTRWVDGQYALQRPELGLSNWQSGRLFARGGFLSGDGVFTVRARMSQQDVRLHR
ncbi:MAG: aldehyde dehydrogenase family protein [Caulobacteraceae bacterium]|nr:aldehyde dehydrogenase family protein [Caulobacteraceae bacterium]